MQLERTVAEPGIHPTAIVHESAEIPESVQIGPYAVIGPDVVLGEAVQIGSHAVIERDTHVGDDCRISNGATLGSDPQDLKYAGERTFLHVGPRTRVREFATLNRGTAATGTTIVGPDCLIMAYAHVAHDCRIAAHVVLANSVNLAGHVEIGEHALIGGLTGVHQFVRIGRCSMVGGASGVNKDVAPFTLVSGVPAVAFGLNRIGLRRQAFSAEAISGLRAAFRHLFRSETPTRRAAMELHESPIPEVRELATFVLESRRGLSRAARANEGPDPRPGRDAGS